MRHWTQLQLVYSQKLINLLNISFIKHLVSKCQKMVNIEHQILKKIQRWKRHIASFVTEMFHLFYSLKESLKNMFQL